MNIKAAGQIYVHPPSTRKLWLGLRKQTSRESVAIIGWWIEDCEFGIPETFVRHWDEFVQAARDAGTYLDYREGTSSSGRIPTGLVALDPPRVVWAWQA